MDVANTLPLRIPLRVDVVSDVVCPWCIIGYKQLEKALAQMAGQFDVSFHWQPFELNPHMPAEGQNLREHIAQKYGRASAESSGARDRLAQLGESLGFHFDYHDDMRMVNTFRAHQLLHWAGEQGLQTELKLALFEAFFSQREDVYSIDVLVDIAQRVGLDGAIAREVLDDGRFAEVVRAEQAIWLDKEVHAVPTFVFNGGYPVPGAQEAATFIRVLEKLRSRELATAD